MTTYSGRYASVKRGTNLIAEQGNFSITMNRDEVDTTAFGDTWGKTDVAMGRWSLTFNGFFDPSDSPQSGLMDAFNAGTLITNIRLYVDNTSFWEPSSGGAGDGGRITALTVGSDKGGVASLSCTISGSGEITFK